MHALQLLAIAALCPLALSTLAGCERVVQPVGEYGRAPQAIVPPSVMKPEQLPTQTVPPDMISTAVPNEAPLLDAGLDAAFPDLTILDGSVLLPPFEPPLVDAGGVVMEPRPEVCMPTTALRAERPRLDMYVVMDANITLPFFGAWEFATTGLQQFVTDARSQGIGVGLRLYGVECEPEPYDANPTVEVDVLGKTAAEIVKQTSQRLSFNASPMAPALEGGILHQRKRATKFPNTKQIVVLLTDGIPQDLSCLYSQQRVETAAENGFNESPSIETHVIGFGLPNNQVAADILARFLPLEPIAASGGSGRAQTLDSGDDPAMMNEALQYVRRMAQPCEYLVPKGLDPSKLSLFWSPGVEQPKVDGSYSCGNREGWYFDNPAQPTRVIVCPNSCQKLHAPAAPTAEFFVGCPPTRRVN